MKFRNALLIFALLACRVVLRADDPKIATASTLEALTNGTPAQIKSFFNSAEYKNLHKSDAEFIKDVFHAVLHREPDPSGYSSWIAAMEKSGDPNAREKAVKAFFKSAEYVKKHPPATTAPIVVKKKTPERIPGNVLFDQTGVFVNSASAFPVDRYAPFLKKGGVTWISLQIDNTGKVRTDNVESINAGWLKAWCDAGFKVGFWGCPRGITRHTDPAAVAESTRLVQEDAALGVKLTAQYHGEFYLADCEDGYQGYSPNDPAPVLNRVYVDAFEKAAAAAGLGKMPRALSSMGRVALDMKPWIEAGWDAMPQAYWNSYAVYQPSKCVDFYVNDAGWPIERVHPTIATYSGEGENRSVTLQDYAADMKTRATSGFSFYLPESYLLFNESLYEQLARMGKH